MPKVVKHTIPNDGVEHVSSFDTHFSQTANDGPTGGGPQTVQLSIGQTSSTLLLGDIVFSRKDYDPSGLAIGVNGGYQVQLVQGGSYDISATVNYKVGATATNQLPQIDVVKVSKNGSSTVVGTMASQNSTATLAVRIKGNGGDIIKLTCEMGYGRLLRYDPRTGYSATISISKRQ